MHKERLYSFDRAKGLAIFLVVLGHLVARGEPPKNADWYLQLKDAIYLFHMPFFMFTSGAVFYYSYQSVHTLAEYWDFSLKKIERLLPPFLIFGLVVLVGKKLSSMVIHVDNVPRDFASSAVDILLQPAQSVAGSLWYIYVLLLVYLAIPVLFAVFRSKTMPLLVFSVVLHFVPLNTHYLMLDRFSEYLMYFAIGILVMQSFSDFERVVSKYFWIFLVAFIVSFASARYVDVMLAKTIVGLCSIPAVYGLVMMEFAKRGGVLLSLGKYTFVIYLLNTIVIGLIKGLMLKVTTWDGEMFVVYFVLALAAGILVPIWIKKYIFVHSSYLDRITK